MDVLTKDEEKDVNKLLNNREIIEREATLAWDGTNILLRLPKDIANYLDITKENRFEKSILFKIKELSESKAETVFEVINRIKKRKIHGKKKTTHKKR